MFYIKKFIIVFSITFAHQQRPIQLFVSSGAEVSDCGNWLILTPIKGCKNNLIYVGNLAEIKEINGKIPLVPIVEKLEADYEVMLFLLGFN